MTSLSPGTWVGFQDQVWFLSCWVNLSSCTTCHINLSCPRIWKFSLSCLLEGFSHYSYQGYLLPIHDLLSVLCTPVPPKKPDISSVNGKLHCLNKLFLFFIYSNVIKEWLDSLTSASLYNIYNLLSGLEIVYVILW